MDTELITLEGRGLAVIFANPENGYTVLRLRAEDGEFTAVGCVPLAAAGEDFVLTGRWISHPEYGRQFEVSHCERFLPEDPEGIAAFLGSGVLHGVGAATAGRIVERFGLRTFDILSADPEALATVRGITPQRARELCEAFAAQMNLRRLLEFLTPYNLPPEVALRLHTSLGPLAMEVLTQNPYILVDEIYGVDFQTADRFAMELGLPPDAGLRMEAALKYELIFNTQNGHVFLPREKLRDATAQLLQMEGADLLEEALERLCACGEILREDICREDACYLAAMHEVECGVAARIIGSLRPPAPLREEDVLPLIAEAERAMGISYAPRQREAVLCAAGSGVMILTGGPGTGKTTTIRGILSVYSQMGLCVALAAPTGRAAKRITQLCGTPAVTLHRLLEAGYAPEGAATAFARGPQNPVEADAVIVDELSMVDLPLMHALLSALRPGTRIILVGDADQLPSVGPGNLLRDLVACGVVPMVHLDEIFRQARESAIVTNAHAVNSGLMPVLTGARDFFFMRRAGAEETVATVLELCRTRLPAYLGADSAQIQVIAPTKLRKTGTYYLNRCLQVALNPAAPGKPEMVLGDMVLRPGDRVMQNRNNYDLAWRRADNTDAGLGVFNGDIGTVTEIDERGGILTVAFDDRLADYAPEQIRELELAYAVTVHKAQGSEFPCVVFVAFDGAQRLLTRNLLYTGLTRARRLLVIVGRQETVQLMVENNVPLKRYTALRVRLRRLALGQESP